MAWYEQLDLDFGSIQDQFTGLIGEASTLLETANNLEILNLDAMAEQELAEELEEEEADDAEEEEVIYHEPDREVADDAYDAAVQMQLPLPSAGAPHKPAFMSPLRPIREVEHHEEDIEWEDSEHDGEQSVPASAEKRVISVDEENASPSKLDSSYSWESVEAMPAKAVKLQLPHSRQAELTAALSSADATAPAHSQDDNQTDMNTGATNTGGKAKPGAAVRPSQPAPKVIPVPAAASTGRKVKPLKPKEKAKKELDFWGVNSKKTITFATLDKNKNTGTVEGSDASQRAIDSISASLDAAKAGKKEKERELADGFFGTMGLFGDDTYFSDTNETDVESSSSSHAASAGGAGTAGSGNKDTTTAAGSTSSQHAQRLPLGWLSSMVSAGVGGDSTTSTTAPSFFDDLEAEVDDPILRQVEYNRLHPHAAAQERANSASLGGSVSRVLDMWNGFMAAADTSVGGVGGGNAVLNSGQNSPLPGGTSTGSSGTSPLPEVYVAGVGPNWAVQVLTWYAFITGVTVVLTDPAGAVCYSGSRGGSAPVGIIRQQIRNNLAKITLSVLTVTVQIPAEKNTLSMCVLALQISKVVCLTVVSVVLRAVVVVATLLYILVRYIAEYVSGTSLGAAVSNSRLRRFFANESVAAVLGETPPAEMGWRERTAQSIQQYRSMCAEQMNSTNGILVLTAVLFLFSYFKFQRYGTDAGD